jgi:uncharacterized repeat protein (TIGR01451 family)
MLPFREKEVMMKRLRILLMVMAVLLTFVTVITPVAAWGASQNVAAVADDFSSATEVCSTQMGCVYFSDYESTIPGLDIVTMSTANVNTANLANFDTLFLFATNPTVFTAQQQADINAFVARGGKLIIWDSEDPGTGVVWNYQWLATPFATAVPGAYGAFGVLDIVVDNQLSSDNPSDPTYIDAAALGSQTDAVGDANVFTSYVPSQWCIDMTADSTLTWMPTGPTHVFTANTASSGIIIYSGLDWDAAGYNAGWTGTNPAGTGLVRDELKKILRNELMASVLPCSPISTTLDVEKTCDKAVYAEGETIVCTITVTNPSATLTAEDVAFIDYPPAEVTLAPTTGTLGDIPPGQSETTTLRGTADEEGCDLENSVVATGYFTPPGQTTPLPIFTGGDTAYFDIGDDCGPIRTPEFPSLAVPAAMVIGFLGVALFIQRSREL